MSETRLLGKVSFTPKGEYSSNATYLYLDTITHDGSSYCAKQTSTGVEPCVTPEWETYWQLLAQRGDTGDTGQQGATGAPGATGQQGTQGYSVDNVYKKSGTGAAGTIDVYGIKINDTNETEVGTFSVYNGANGSGAGDMIKVVYDANNNGVVDNSEKLGGNLPEWYQQATNGLPDETTLVDADTLPFYDASASSGRKTTWSNLKSILKAYFDALYTASIHASRHSEGGADAISPADIGAAVPATDLTANLAVASWVGASAPYTQTVSGLSGVTANSKLDIGLAETATDAQFIEAVAAQIRATGSGAGTVSFKAHGTKPTGALPILIRMVD